VSRRPIEVAVECGEAVVGHPLTVSAVIRARRDVQIGGVAVAFAGKWLMARPWYTSGFERGEQLWGTVTLVSAEAPVAMSAGEERRWSAETGVALFPTKPALGRSSIEYDHSVEMAVSPVGHLLPRRAWKRVLVGSPRWVNADRAGFVVRRDERVWVHARVADVMPGGMAVLATRPEAGATAELVREERWLHTTPGAKPRSRRKRFGRTTARADGVVTLAIPDGASPTMRHSQGEVRWVRPGQRRRWGRRGRTQRIQRHLIEEEFVCDFRALPSIASRQCEGDVAASRWLGPDHWMSGS